MNDVGLLYHIILCIPDSISANVCRIANPELVEGSPKAKAVSRRSAKRAVMRRWSNQVSFGSVDGVKSVKKLRVEVLKILVSITRGLVPSQFVTQRIDISK